MQGKRQLAAGDVLVDELERCAHENAELVQCRGPVAGFVQFLPHPGILDLLFVAHQILAAGVAGGERFHDGFAGQHAGLHGGMVALDLGRIEEAGLASDHHAAGEGQLGQGVQPPLVHRPGAIGNALAAFQGFADRGMGLPALEFLERKEVGILVVERNDVAAQNLVVFPVIEKAAAFGPGVHRPARGMNHQSGFVLGGIDFPDFLEPDAVMLDIAVAAQVELLHQALAQMPAAAFGEHRVLGAQFHARGIAVLGFAFLGHAHVARDDTADRPLVVVDHIGGGVAGEDVGTHGFGLIAQPAHQLAQADDVVAFVVHGLGQECIGGQYRALFAQQEVHLVMADRHIQGRAALLPIGEQLVECGRLEDRSGQAVRAEFRAFLDHADLDLLASLFSHLENTAGAGQSGRARADDDDIELHYFPFHHYTPYFDQLGDACPCRIGHITQWDG